MYTYWAEYINEFKGIAFADRKLLSENRLSLNEDEIDFFWDQCTLRQMESIFTIQDQYVINFLSSQLLQPYLSSRKIIHEAYIVSRVDERNNQQSLMYIYDCRLFRSSLYSKEQNDFVSAFLLLYKENVDIQSPVYEVVDCNNLPACKWILKIKESAILRVYSYIKQIMRKVVQKCDKIVLPEEKYINYMQEWLKCYYNYNIDTTVSFFFKGILALLQNQLLIHYKSTITNEQIYERMYKRPIKSIEKPKNVEQFTLTEGLLQTETKWQTLKITAFRLKYRIQQTQDKYDCYLVEQSQEDTNEQDDLSEQDQLIIIAFSTVKRADEEYQTLYY